MENNLENICLLGSAALLLTLVANNNLKTKNKKQKKKIWTRKWLQKREENRGILSLVEMELLNEDPDAYKNFLRMTSNQFNFLLSLTEARISRCDTVMRQSIPASKRLSLTLRFLATGESFRSLMYATRIHESTTSKIVTSVLEVIYEVLAEKYLKIPNSEEEWMKISNNFYKKWNFPNCMGALDGKHIGFRPPKRSGSYYYNYKKFHSIVLLGLADADYKFIYISVGTNGRVSDGGVYRESTLAHALNNNLLNLPENCNLPGTQVMVPYVMVADDAFSLSKNIMKPYPQRNLTQEKRVFNYRLSRARNVIENAFGILANRFRVLLTTINLSVTKVELITLASCALHNYLLTDNAHYAQIDEPFINTMPRINQQGGNRTSRDSLNIRTTFLTYFNSNEGLINQQI